MLISEQTDKLFAALSKMQSELGTAQKAKDGYGYKYADLAECLAVAKNPLAENGLAVSQMIGDIQGIKSLITILTHASGQYVGSEFRMEDAVLSGGAGKNPAQKMGASITYMRRYAFAAIIGLSQEDTDASNKQQQQPQSNKQQTNTQAITANQIKWLQAFYSNGGYDRDARLHSLSKWCQRTIGSMNELTIDEASGLIDAIQKDQNKGERQ